MQLYVLIGDETHGPYSGEEIETLLKSGQLASSSLACVPGGDEWTPPWEPARKSQAADIPSD